MNTKKIDTGYYLDSDTSSSLASSIEPDFSKKLAAYSDLGNSGLIPKTGFKFGNSF
jgi:tRNA splicing endonuclease